jgi:hypothetical protein
MHLTRVVCSWVGNGEAIARKHYLQVTDTYFAQSTAKEMQKPSVLPCSYPHSVIEQNTKHRELQDIANKCKLVQTIQTVGLGFEPRVPGGTPVFKTGAFDHSATRPICLFSRRLMLFLRV